MQIAVIADTHGHLPDSLIREIKGADEIWHLGDFCDLSILEAVRKIGPSVHAVSGNNDFGLGLPHWLVLNRCEHAFTLIHIAPKAVVNTPFLLHGHTHVPRDETIMGNRILNPGAVGKANHGAPPSFAWLRLSEGQNVIWEVVRI